MSNQAKSKGRPATLITFNSYKDIPLSKMKTGETLKIGTDTSLKSIRSISQSLEKVTSSMRKSFTLVVSKKAVSIIRTK